jgi:hypothetical protein
MTTKPNLALLSAITGIIGLVLAIYGGLYLFAPTFQNTPVSQNLQTPVGFAFATTAPLVQDETLFNLYYNSIDANRGTVNVTARVTFQCKEWAKTDLHLNGETMYFILQVPSQIDKNSVIVHYNRDYQDPQFWGGTYSCENGNGTEKISRVTVEVPIKNFTYDASSYLEFKFEMKNAFVRINQFTYQLGISFTTNLGSDNYGSDGLREITPISGIDSLVFRWVARASLYVEQPDNRYFLSQIMPVSNGIHYYAGNTHYSWDVKAISTSFGTDSIILTIEDNVAKEKGTIQNQFAYLFLGIGIPLAISSLAEYIRERNKNIINCPFRINYFKNRIILASICILCVVIILPLVYFFWL